jgi:hypothetical protein
MFCDKGHEPVIAFDEVSAYVVPVVIAVKVHFAEKASVDIVAVWSVSLRLYQTAELLPVCSLLTCW